MKRTFSLILALLLTAALMASCDIRSSKAYSEGFDDGYNEGYDKGRADAEASSGGYDEGYEDGSDNGFYDGYEEGYREGVNYGWKDNMDEVADYFVWEAVHYVREESEWHPEEAMMIVEAYENQEPFWEDGSPPSYDDYQEAVHSLYRFYEYFYNSEYSD